MVIKLDKGKISFVLALIFMVVSSLIFLFKGCKTEEKGFSIIMYHHISNNQSMLGDYVITPELFESDICYLKQNGYVSITPQDLYLVNKNKKSLPEKAVMITFDDADESFLTYAFPVLKKYNMTAVLSVVGYYAEHYTKSSNPDIPFAYLDFEQIKMLSDSGKVVIANHTYHMHEHKEGKRFGTKKLIDEDDEDYKKALMNDLNTFNKLSKEKLGYITDVFTFPFGEISREAPPILKEMGFKALLTCKEEKVIPGNSQDWLLSLGRFNRSFGKNSEEFFRTVL